jgi:glycosyltransferase involved in cell wall biosynthesis
MPLFSVVIPTYNRRERLLRAVGSVLAQTWEDWELIVVDDGSTDGTPEALRGLDPRLIVHIKANGGPSAARNSGARLAKGEYLAFLDSDDAWLPWTLARYAEALDGSTRATWLFGRGFRDAADPSPPSDAPLLSARFDSFIDAAARDGVMPLPSGVAVHREAYLAASGFRETMRVAEDLDLWFRLGTAPGFVLLESPATCIRETHGGSLGEHTERSFEGLGELIGNERSGRYPGDLRAAFVRRGMITRQLMYYAAQYVRRGRRALAARFYADILRFQASGGFREPAFGGRRNRFLLTFPLFFASPRLHALLKRP